MSRLEKHLYEFGHFRLDTAERLLLHKGQPVPLAPKVFDTLVVLVQHSRHLLTKNELMQEVWPDSFVEEVNLTVNISALRKALGDDQDRLRYIETVPKRGYRFVAGVRELEGDNAALVVEQISSRGATEEAEESGVLSEYVEAQQVPEDKDLTASRRANREARWRLRPATLAALVALIGLVALSSLLISRESKETGAAPSVRSIAVLPFKLLETDGGDEYLGLGMADTLITKLSNVQQIIVRPTSAVGKYNTPEQDPVAIGREQRVDAVLEGSIRRFGAQVRVTVQLVSVRDGRPLWADKFDEKFTDILAIEDLVTERVARALTLELTGEEMKARTRHYTESAEAFENYLKGRFFSNKASTEGWKKGLEYFERAIKIDPAYAPAYAGLAITYIRLGLRGLLRPQEGWLRKAESAALKALEIDETLPEAHASLGWVRLHEWHLSAADVEFKRAVELNPGSVETYNLYVNYLQIMGRFDEAIVYTKRAHEFDPLSVTVNGHLAKGFLRAGRYDEAIDQYLKVLEIEPNFIPAHNNLAAAYAAKGMYEEAIAEIKESIALDNSPQRRGQLAALGRLYALSGRKDEARKVLDELKEHSQNGYIPAYNLALVYEALGDKDQALQWLEKAYGERDSALLELRRDGFDSLRSDPRFTDLLRRIKASCR